ncbi:MAG TPA: large-conductance mechanosensitive channel protein MscL [Oceanithermus profundus]|uniref:Large-conductance mechanosensitive channel n=1 Tax=Oceanithermus profundus TaxID=187137 RepID=A0A7C4ZH02_9DEIN|nr:large-conductance mechanosensitive channel protein MscL [Oceanithermus profundus]
MIKEFKEFIMRGNVLDMAIGIVIGAAFGALVKSFVANILMPPIGLLMGGRDFSNLFVVLKSGTQPGPYATIEAAKEAGAVVWPWGVFVNEVVTFLIIAFAIFLVVRTINQMKRKEEEAPPPPPEPSAEEKLLSEIRDLLAQK